MRWIREAPRLRPALLVLCVALAGALLLAAPALRSEEPPAAGAGAASDIRQQEPVRHHPVELRPVGKPTSMATGETDALGAPIVVACSTCHSLRADEPPAATSADLAKFHKGFRVEHGDRTCLACHNPKDYDTLRLADGKPVPFTRSMELCGQCHGTQRRDYEHGAHGGMNGYWDLTRGPRVRNQCVHCHDPHVPAFPRMRPTFKPRDRFLEKGESDDR